MGFRVSFGLAAAALALSAFAGLAHSGEAGRPVGVVELFTSQGCSSCPPADKVLADLAEAGDVVALAYHVDYWDYLGWRDTLATEENTERQRGYMRTFGTRSVYTPQAVVNGRTHVNGAKRAAIDQALSEMAGTGKGLPVEVKVSRQGDSVIIEAAKADGGDTGAHVVLVYFDPAQEIEIDRGENKGEKVIYWNAVTGIQTAGMWHGEAERYELPASEIAKKGTGGCAVLLQSVGQEGLPGPILGAAVIDPSISR